MKFVLNDGSVAHLVSVVQNRNYQVGYREIPSDATEEILRIATSQIPKDSWRSAPFVLIGQERENLNTLLRSKKLPSVLCVGLFYSIRGGSGSQGKPSYVYVAWLQDELVPHMDASNQAALAAMKWPNPD
jgi:hypothetical protein